ncbi:MAG TPA: RIP metalloprotease RseP [Gemmatimonadota bacterium]|nr:RIP metalloprotease RseP [Gemmatimonadota bacterium]
MLTTLLATAVVLGVLILVHELGHFMAAKAVDIEVPRFSIGMGPRAVGFRWGETEYVISWLPLGGYVKMAGMGEEEAFEALEGGAEPGEDGEAREPSDRDFDAKSLPARALVISAGVIMNFLFAVVAFAVIGGIWGVPPEPPARLGGVEPSALPPGTYALSGVPPGSRIDSVGGRAVSSWSDLSMALATAEAGPITLHFQDVGPVTIRLPAEDSLRSALLGALQPDLSIPAVLSEVESGSPADSAGLQPGDRVVEAEGKPVRGWQDFVQTIKSHPGTPLPVTVERDGSRVPLRVVPEARTNAGAEDTLRYGFLGVSVSRGLLARQLAPVRVGPLEAVGHGFDQAWVWTRTTVDIVVGLVTGRVSARSLGGPIMIGKVSGEAARLGISALLRFMAILSINLAILNLLPVPVLDGGHLLFLGIEGVRGRPLSLETRLRWTKVGLFLVAALMIWAIASDLLRLFGG